MSNVISVCELLNSSPHDVFIIAINIQYFSGDLFKNNQARNSMNYVGSPRTTAQAHGLNGTVLFLELQ